MIDLDVILYDIEGKSLSMRQINEGTRDAFSILKKGKYSVNLDLRGADITKHIDAAESQYMKHMTDNLMFPELHTDLRLKSTCVFPFQDKTKFLPRDILPDDVQDDPMYVLYNAEKDDIEVINLAKSQLMRKGINPFYIDDDIPEKINEEKQSSSACDGDYSDQDFDQCCSSKDEKPTKSSQRRSTRKSNSTAPTSRDDKSVKSSTNVIKPAAAKKVSKTKVLSSQASANQAATAAAIKATEVNKNTEVLFSKAEVDAIVAQAAKDAEAKYETSLTNITAQMKLMQEQINQQNLTHHACDTSVDTKAAESDKKRKNDEHAKTVIQKKKGQNLSEDDESDDDDSDQSSEEESSCDEDLKTSKLLKLLMESISKDKRKRKKKRRRHEKKRHRWNETADEKLKKASCLERVLQLQAVNGILS